MKKIKLLLVILLAIIGASSVGAQTTTAFAINPETTIQLSNKDNFVVQIYPQGNPDAAVNFANPVSGDSNYGATFTNAGGQEVTAITKVEKVAGAPNSFKITFNNNFNKDFDSYGYNVGFPAGTFLSESYVNGDALSEHVKFIVPIEPYALLSNNGATLTFYYDKNKATYPNEDVFAIPWNGDYPGWTSNGGNDNITTVVFNESFANYDGLESTKNMFYDLRNLKTISNLQYLKTENVTDMSNMFYGLSEIETINNLQYLNTENVSNMSGMFDHCYKLKTLDLSNFNTSSVTNMSKMFKFCKVLSSVDLSKFNTSNVTDMQEMFWETYELENIFCAKNTDWTNNNANKSNMFSGCFKLSGKYGNDKFEFKSSNPKDGTYAKVYMGDNTGGYFTYIGNLNGQSVTLNGNGYATYSSSLPVDFTNASGYTAWKITGIEGETITFEQITGSVAAGTGVLLMGEAGASFTVKFSTYGDAHSDNMLVGFTTATNIASNEYYGLSGNQFMKVNGGTVPAGKALLPVPVEGNTVKTLDLVFNDETGIIETRTVNAEQATGIFNLAGQRLEKPQRDINIVNGKKVLVK